MLQRLCAIAPYQKAARPLVTTRSIAGLRWSPYPHPRVFSKQRVRYHRSQGVKSNADQDAEDSESKGNLMKWLFLLTPLAAVYGLQELFPPEKQAPDDVPADVVTEEEVAAIGATIMDFVGAPAGTLTSEQQTMFNDLKRVDRDEWHCYHNNNVKQRAEYKLVFKGETVAGSGSTRGQRRGDASPFRTGGGRRSGTAPDLDGAAFEVEMGRYNPQTKKIGWYQKGLYVDPYGSKHLVRIVVTGTVCAGTPPTMQCAYESKTTGAQYGAQGNMKLWRQRYADD